MKPDTLKLLAFGALILLMPSLEWTILCGQDTDPPSTNKDQHGLVGYWPKVDQPVDLTTDAAPRLETGNFSMAVWIRHDEQSGFAGGDIVSQYDLAKRRGFHLTLKSNPGVTSNQANWRHLQFGIDDNRASNWNDCGRPGNALFAFAMTAHAGQLYVGTCEPDGQDSGRVYRYVAPDQWQDCGSLDGSNSVTAMAEYHGRLYAGTGKYRVAGSALPESENITLGGKVFCYDGDDRWVDCGQLPDCEAVGGLVQFRGKLYASSLYRPAGFYRYEGQQQWTRLPLPMGPENQAAVQEARSPTESEVLQQVPRRVVSLTVFDGYLFATSYDCGNVYRFDGDHWTDCGLVGDNTQCYAFVNYQGRLHVATWPSGRVYQFEGVGNWIDKGRLGDELEVMGMLVHNGRLIAGTLPTAQVYAYEGGQNWSLLEQLDKTPDVKYRRAWTMCEFGGKAFCTTLPSGRVFSFSQGRQVSWEHSLSSEWHHVVAVKSTDRLSLWLDGNKVSETLEFDAHSFDLSSSASWRLANGTNGVFHGQLRELRVYHRELAASEIERLSSVRLTDRMRPIRD